MVHGMLSAVSQLFYPMGGGAAVKARPHSEEEDEGEGDGCAPWAAPGRVGEGAGRAGQQGAGRGGPGVGGEEDLESASPRGGGGQLDAAARGSPGRPCAGAVLKGRLMGAGGGGKVAPEPPGPSPGRGR